MIGSASFESDNENNIYMNDRINQTYINDHGSISYMSEERPRYKRNVMTYEEQKSYDGRRD